MSEKSKNILLGVLIVGLVSMTVAYAALSTSLQINGTANVAATTWDIHFAGVQVDTENTTAGLVYNLGTLDNDATTSGATGTLINGLTVTLNKPGDKLTVNFNIVNAGTIDAKNTSFTKSVTYGNSTVTTEGKQVNDVVDYNITCGAGANGSDSVLTKSDGNNATAACTLTIEYNDKAASITQPSQTAGQNQTINNDAKTFTFNAAWVYQQN